MLRKQLQAYRDEADTTEYTLSGLNRADSMNPPSDWDDIKVAASYETDYRNKT